MWDRVRSTRANQMVKIKVEELRDISTSIVFGDGDNSDSLTVPVVILQHHILGEEPHDEDPVDPHGNPHPIPNQVNFHPNQHNHFVGPIQQHEHEEVQAMVNQQQAPRLDLNMMLNQAENDALEIEEEQEMPGWGHWAIPDANPNIDLENH
ncbi:hypothetical protein VPH35_073267 [Triticum aestivum]